MGNENDDLGPGEIRRGFTRLEAQLDKMAEDVSRRYNDLANKMTSAIGPISEVRYRCDEHRKDIDELADKLRTVEKAQNLMELRAAGIGGGVAAVAFIVKFLLGK
jgi:phage host-nuclease inhibitor protein Gam